jgi:hypothetical protein
VISRSLRGVVVWSEWYLDGASKGQEETTGTETLQCHTFSL